MWVIKSLLCKLIFVFFRRLGPCDPPAFLLPSDSLGKSSRQSRGT